MIKRIWLRQIIQSGQVLSSFEIPSVHLVCKFQEDPIEIEWIMLITVKQRLVQQSRGRNSKIHVNDPIQPVFELVRDFILIHSICKFQENPIKTERSMLISKPIRCFFSNQGEVKICEPLASFWTCSRFYPCASYLQVSGRSDQNWMSLLTFFSLISGANRFKGEWRGQLLLGEYIR